MIIKILGTGCPKCKKLEANTLEAIKLSAIDASVEKVTELDKIMIYGVMLTPAMVIGEKVVSTGKLLSTNEIVKLLIKEQGQ